MTPTRRHSSSSSARVSPAFAERRHYQVQLAETLNVSQQTVASWEVGRRGVPVSTLPSLARALSINVESLIGEKTTRQARPGTADSAEDRAAHALAKGQAKLVMDMLDGVLAQASR